MPSYPYAQSITNPGAESGVTGWTNDTGTLASVTSGGSNSPISGTNFFRAGASASTKCHQDVTIALDALTDVDAGTLVAKLAGYHGGAAADADMGRLSLIFLDASSAQIGPEYQMVPKDQAGGNVWEHRVIRAWVPTLARKIRITQYGTRGTGTNLDSYWDDFTLDLEQPADGVPFGVAGCELWLTGSEISEADGVAVSTWTDKSGLQYDVTGTTTTRPVSRPGGTLGLDGQPTVEADGSDDIMSGGDNLSMAGRAGLTIFAAIHHDIALGTGSNGDIIARDGSGNRGYRLSINSDGRLMIQVASSASARTQRDGSTVNLLDMPAVVRARFNGGTGELSLWVNGVLDNGTLTNSVPATIANPGSDLKIFGSGFAGRFRGQIGDVVVYGQALSDADCETIEAALLAQYSLYVLEETDTSPDTDSHQGCATDGTNEYTIDTAKIYKRDASWTELLNNAAPFSGISSIQHLSDGAYADGKLYIELDNYPTSVETPKYIATYDVSDLSRLSATDVTSAAGSIVGLAIDEVGGIVYGIGLDGTDLLLHQWNLSGLSYIGADTLDFTGYQPQGISYRSGQLWCSFGDDATAEGLLAVIDPVALTVRPVYRRYLPSGEKSEGLDFTQDALRWTMDHGTAETVHLFDVTGGPAAAPPAVTVVTVTPSSVAGGVGDTASLTAVVYDQYGAVMGAETASWASDDTGVATVDSSGVVTFAGVGTCTITATSDTDGGVTDTAAVLVTETGLFEGQLWPR